jgi:hypothetical protein
MKKGRKEGRKGRKKKKEMRAQVRCSRCLLHEGGVVVVLLPEPASAWTGRKFGVKQLTKFMANLAEQVANLKKEVDWLRKAVVATAKLGVRTEGDVAHLKAAKRHILFLNGEARDHVATMWSMYKKGRDEAMEKKAEIETSSALDAMDEGTSTEKKKKPHWGTELYSFILNHIKEILKAWGEEDSGHSAILVQGLESVLAEVYSMDPSRIVKFAFPHTESPEADKSWAWTIQFFDNESATKVREAMMFELQPLMRKQQVSMKQDQPSLEGGNLTKDVRNLIGLPKPEKKGKKPKKRGAAPATPMKDSGGSKESKTT